MKLNFKEILEGWRNHLVPPSDLKDLIHEVHEERMAICRACPMNSENRRKEGDYKSFRIDEHCTSCGCPLAAKTKSLSSACPLGNWAAITNDEDRYEIEQQIRKENENNELQTRDSQSSEEPDGELPNTTNS